MSFILDALRKSEHERQRQGGPGISDLQPAIVGAHLPGWAIALGALLLVNIAVVLILVLRSEPSSQAAPPPKQSTATAPQATPQPPAPSASAVPQAPASQYALPPPVLSQAPAQYEPDPAPLRADVQRQAYQEEVGAPLDPLLDAAQPMENIPTLSDVQMQGSGRVPEMHLDLHVFSSRPGDRFVFLNGRKYREGAATPEGTRIERITPDGVVLNHRGLRFLLPRQ